MSVLIRLEKNMSELIKLAKGKLDDPILLEWALNRYRDAKERGGYPQDQMEQIWFDDLTLSRLLANHDQEILGRLFSLLPAEKFANLGPVIGKQWKHWSGNLARLSAPVFARYDSENAFNCFQRPPGGGHPDAETVLGVIHGLPYLPCDEGLSLLLEISDEVKRTEENFMKNTFLHALLSSSIEIDIESALSISRTLLQSAIQDNSLEQALREVADVFFNANTYHHLAKDIRTGISSQRFQSLNPLFVKGAPLDQLDQWSREKCEVSEIAGFIENNLGELELVHTFVEMLPKDAIKKYREEVIDFLVGVIAASYQYEDLPVLEMSALDTVTLLASDLAELPHFDLLLNSLRNVDEEELSTLLVETLEQHRDTYGGVHIATAMGKLGWVCFIPILLDSMSDNSGDFLCEAAHDSLLLIGVEAQKHLIAQWDTLDDSQKIYGSGVVSAIGGDLAASFALDQVDELMSWDPEYWCRLAASAPDIRLFERLAKELPREQRVIDDAFYPLARLLEMDHPEIDAVRKRIEQRRVEQKDRAALFESGNRSQAPLKLSLLCPECGDSNEYDVQKIVLDPEKNDNNMLLAEEIVCASCKKSSDLEFTADARMAITANLIPLLADRDIERDRPSFIVSIDTSMNGRPRPVGEVVGLCKDVIEKNPSSVPHLVRLGYCYHRLLSRPLFALDYAERALQLEPNAVEASLQKAEALVKQKEDEQAFEVLEDALSHKEAWRFFLSDLSSPVQLSAQFAKLYNDLLRWLRRNDRPNLHSSFLGANKKVGRNDPCPCGSGKKFKKCCM